MSKFSKDDEKLDVLQPLPSNLDVLPREKILKIARDLGIMIEKNREEIIKKIRRAHARKRLEKIRKSEKENRRFISLNMKKDWAKKRLMKDLKEIQMTELNYVCAQPLQADIFEWHVNVLAPQSCRYYPMVLHLVLSFTEEYPLKPPKCRLVTPLHHSHVFDDWICLDLLETHDTVSSYSGWSSSYSGHNPSEEKFFPIWSYWGDDIKRKYFQQPLKNGAYNGGRRRLRRLKAFEEEEEEEDENVSERTKSLLSVLPEEVLIYIFQFLDPRVFLRFSMVSKAWRRMVFHPYLWKNELKCYHSKLGFREDSLGLGLNIQKKFKKIHQVSTPLDILGRHSFEDQKIRKSPWNVPFNNWIPLYIDDSHWDKSRGFFESLVAKMYHYEEEKNKKEEEEEEEEGEGEVYINVRKKKLDEVERKFEPHQAVDFCCKLMTSMVVEIMKGELHGSIKAIQGYSYFYRILIYYVTKFPRLRNEIDYNIGKFIEHERYRNKRYVPNLGDFISLLSVSRLFSWDDVRDAFIDEVFDRNSFWMNKKFDILFAEDEAKRERRKPTKSSSSSSSSSNNNNQERMRRRVTKVNIMQDQKEPKKIRTTKEQDRRRRYRQRKRKLKSEMKKLAESDPEKHRLLLEERRQQHEMVQKRTMEKKDEEEEKERRRKREEMLKIMAEKRKALDKRRKEEAESRKRNEKMRKNIRVSFRCVEVSLRFTLFHLSFLKRIRDNDNSIEKIADGYDRRYGNEDLSIMNGLQKDVFEVQDVDNFLKFFKCSGYSKIFDSIPQGLDKKLHEQEERVKIIEKLEVADRNFRRRGYNRRIDTSGSILTGNFRRSIEEVKQMLSSERRYNPRNNNNNNNNNNNSFRRRRSGRKREEEEEDVNRKTKRVMNSSWRRRPNPNNMRFNNNGRQRHYSSGGRSGNNRNNMRLGSNSSGERMRSMGRGYAPF